MKMDKTPENKKLLIEKQQYWALERTRLAQDLLYSAKKA